LSARREVEGGAWSRFAATFLVRAESAYNRRYGADVRQGLDALERDYDNLLSVATISEPTDPTIAAKVALYLAWLIGIRRPAEPRLETLEKLVAIGAVKKTLGGLPRRRGRMTRLEDRQSVIEGAYVLTIPPPPVQGIGNAGGFKMMLEDRTMASCVSSLGFSGICSRPTGAMYSGRSARATVEGHAAASTAQTVSWS
jgi:hypothetical protein